MKAVVEGFPNYAIDDRGNVYNIKSGKMLLQYKHKTGYMYIWLRNKDGKKYLRVHRLVAAAFISNPNNYDQVNHINENKADNRVENLEWCDSKYNNNYGSHKENVAKKISKSVVCVETNIVYSSIMAAEKETGVGSPRISEVCTGKRKTAGGYHWKFA